MSPYYAVCQLFRVHIDWIWTWMPHLPSFELKGLWVFSLCLAWRGWYLDRLPIESLGFVGAWLPMCCGRPSSHLDLFSWWNLPVQCPTPSSHVPYHHHCHTNPRLPSYSYLLLGWGRARLSHLGCTRAQQLQEGSRRTSSFLSLSETFAKILTSVETGSSW